MTTWMNQRTAVSDLAHALIDLTLSQVDHRERDSIRQDVADRSAQQVGSTVQILVRGVLSAVPAERRYPLAGEIARLAVNWLKVYRSNGRRDGAGQVDAHRPLMRVAEQAAQAQIDGTLFWFKAGYEDGVR